MIIPQDNHCVITRMKSPITHIYDTAVAHHECHRLPVVAHHTVRYVAHALAHALATLFDSGEPPVAHQWQIPPSDCRLRATGSPPVAFLPLIATGGPLERCSLRCRDRDISNTSLVEIILSLGNNCSTSYASYQLRKSVYPSNLLFLFTSLEDSVVKIRQYTLLRRQIFTVPQCHSAPVSPMYV